MRDPTRCRTWGNGEIGDGGRLRSGHRQEAEKYGQEQPVVRCGSRKIQGVVVVASAQFMFVLSM